MFADHRVRHRKAAGAALALTSAILILAGMATGGRSPAVAVATDVDLGTAGTFSVLGGSAVTNTGPTVLSGDLGVSPGSSITGFTGPPAGSFGGTLHQDDAVAAGAQSDLTIAYNNAAGQAADVTLASAELGGLTLTSGVYKNPADVDSLQLTGTLTLDAQGNPDAVFIFQIASTLTTASNSTVMLINGADPCHVFWQVGSSATLGTNTTFVGTIMALTSVTLNTGATIQGRALARNGAVTLDTNTITTPDCADGGGGGTDTEGTATTGTDTEGTATTGTDTEGTATTGTDTEGAATTGTDTEGTTTEATDTEGTTTEATDTEGTDTQGTDTQGTDTEGTDTQGTDTQGSDTQGTDTQGTDTQGTDTEGSDTNGTEEEGDEDEHGDSKDHDVVPKGHPRTGLGGTATKSNPYSVVLLAMGGVAGLGSLILFAPTLRRSTRQQP